MSEKFTSRKFILAIILMALVTVLRVFNKLTDDNYAHLLIAFFGIYCGANVASKFTK